MFRQDEEFSLQGFSRKCKKVQKISDFCDTVTKDSRDFGQAVGPRGSIRKDQPHQAISLVVFTPNAELLSG